MKKAILALAILIGLATAGTSYADGWRGEHHREHRDHWRGGYGVSYENDYRQISRLRFELERKQSELDFELSSYYPNRFRIRELRHEIFSLRNRIDTLQERCDRRNGNFFFGVRF